MFFPFKGDQEAEATEEVLQYDFEKEGARGLCSVSSLPSFSVLCFRGGFLPAR